MFEVSVSGSFEATHYIDAPEGAPDYKRMHGHPFLVTASMTGLPTASGWITDLGRFEAALKQVLAGLDHAVLNEIPGLEKPTFENLLVWIAGQLKVAGYPPSRVEIERPILRQRAVYTLD